MAKTFVNFSLPKDQSLPAYKAWILEISFKLTGKMDDTSMTDEKWEADWRAFSAPDKKDEA